MLSLVLFSCFEGCTIFFSFSTFKCTISEISEMGFLVISNDTVRLRFPSFFPKLLFTFSRLGFWDYFDNQQRRFIFEKIWNYLSQYRSVNVCSLQYITFLSTDKKYFKTVNGFLSLVCCFFHTMWSTSQLAAKATTFRNLSNKLLFFYY